MFLVMRSERWKALSLFINTKTDSQVHLPELSVLSPKCLVTSGAMLSFLSISGASILFMFRLESSYDCVT